MERRAFVILGLRKQALPIVRAISRYLNVDIYCFVDTRFPKEEAYYTRYGVKIKFSSISDLQIELKTLQHRYKLKLYVFIIAAYLLTEIRENFRSIYDEYDVSSSPLKWIDIFTDKLKMYSYVEKFHIETSPAIMLTQYEQGCMRFPLILKRNVEHYLSFKTKLVVNEEELRNFVDWMPDKHEYVLVQELVWGKIVQDFSFQAYVFNGIIKGDLVLEEVRHYPAGISCFLKELGDGTLKSRIIAYSESFLKGIEYSGFIQIDYKYVEDNNRLVIMDINTRTPASHSAFAHKFTNYAQLFAELDNPPILQPKKKMIKWVNVMSDIKWHIKERKYKGIFSFMCATWDLWSWKDPMPFCMSILQPCINKLGNLCKK